MVLCALSVYFLGLILMVPLVVIGGLVSILSLRSPRGRLLWNLTHRELSPPEVMKGTLPIP